jgi:hypothetical protein
MTICKLLQIPNISKEDSSVGIVTTLWSGYSKNWTSISGRVNRLFSSPRLETNPGN